MHSKKPFFIFLFLLVGCDLLPKAELSEEARTKSMEKSLQKQCAVFANCADLALELQLSFTLRHRRSVSGKEIICNPSEARLDEYYDQLGSKFEVLDSRKKFLNEKCFVEKLKGLVLDRADPTGRYNETYHLKMSLDPRSKNCSISVTKSLLIDAG